MRALFTGLSLAAVLAAVAMTPAFAGDIPYADGGEINQETYSFSAENTGMLTAYFYASAGASNVEFLNIYDTTANTSLTNIFPNKTTATGATASLSVTMGDALVFTIFDQTTGQTISSIASQNADGDEHIYSTSFAGGPVNLFTDSGLGSATLPSGTYVGFEDTLAGRSDFNYADEQFVFTDTASTTVTPVPEPSSLAIFAVGLLATGYWAYRRRKLV